jgi:hypothetical protein
VEACAFSIGEKLMQLALVDAEDTTRSQETSAQFAIQNLSKDLDFEFRLVLENPPGIPLTQLLSIQPALLGENDMGIVPPEGQLMLRCSLRPGATRLPDAIRIRVVDMHAITEQSLILTLRAPSVVKRPMPAIADTQVEEKETDQERLGDSGGGYLTVRGCRRIGDDPYRFELDLGQLDVGSPAVVKSMVLTSGGGGGAAAVTTELIPYSVCIIPASSTAWLSVNRTRGRLNSQGPTSSNNNNNNSSSSSSSNITTGHILNTTGDEDSSEHTLTITAIPSEISVFAAHLVIESSRDPVNRIMIRVNMEASGRSNVGSIN